MRSTAMAVDGAARRRRERRFRGHWKHECLSVRMAVAAAMHHSSGKRVVATAEVAVQTERAPVTEHVAPDVIMPPPSSGIEYVAPAPGRARKKRHFEAQAPVVDKVASDKTVTYAATSLVSGCVDPAHDHTYAVPASVIGYVDPAPIHTDAAPAAVIEHVAAPAVTFAAPATVIEHVPAPAVTYTAPVPVIAYVDPAPAPAPVDVYVAPAPAPPTQRVLQWVSSWIQHLPFPMRHKRRSTGYDDCWENIAGQRVRYRTSAEMSYAKLSGRECQPGRRIQAILTADEDWLIEYGSGEYLPLRHSVDAKPLFRQCRPQGWSSVSVYAWCGSHTIHPHTTHPRPRWNTPTHAHTYTPTPTRTHPHPHTHKHPHTHFRVFCV